MNLENDLYLYTFNYSEHSLFQQGSDLTPPLESKFLMDEYTILSCQHKNKLERLYNLCADFKIGRFKTGPFTLSKYSTF